MVVERHTGCGRIHSKSRPVRGASAIVVWLTATLTRHSVAQTGRGEGDFIGKDARAREGTDRNAVGKNAATCGDVAGSQCAGAR